ncbi:putative polyhydroxyalkanoate system protein [Halospina denitrificans]|uniref:Putative polyhydroxyalkanoate system protein n=1 Tax=Halospina denitrificans TaxID=332522 RepID=A0A4R7JQT8_9GAMM|nr:polyhydroxyalkanoic acid system family protein [Halospina denitrificans]TDT40144.1 putative polyhydroxyalkanoate system protein [Halospina denitrificans]
MSRIDVRRSHSMDHEHALRVADELAREMESHYDFEWHWEGEKLRLRRSGIKGEVEVLPEEIGVHLELGMMLRPFRHRIEGEVIRQLEEILARN